jgi:hypothetical protein
MPGARACEQTVALEHFHKYCGAGWYPAADWQSAWPAERNRAGRLPIGRRLTNLPHSNCENALAGTELESCHLRHKPEQAFRCAGDGKMLLNAVGLGCLAHASPRQSLEGSDLVFRLCPEVFRTGRLNRRTRHPPSLSTCQLHGMTKRVRGTRSLPSHCSSSPR